MTTDSIKVNAVEKALKILLLLSTHGQGLGTGEISEELGFSLPTASRLLSTLSKYEFVRKSDPGKKYILSRSAGDIGQVALSHMGSQLIPIARPFIEALRDTTRESTMLEVMEGDNALIILRANGSHLVSIMVGKRTVVPVHVSAGGKAILAYSSQEVVNNFLKRRLPHFTPETKTEPQTLKRELEKIRETGIACSLGDYNVNVHAFGAPIFGADKKPVAAIVITMPTFRSESHERSELTASLKETARKISEQLSLHGL